MNVLTSGLPRDAASDRNVKAGVAQQVLVVGLEPVEVVVVLPLASLPPKAHLIQTSKMYNCFKILHQHRLDTDLFYLRGDDGEVGLHVPVQEVGHHHTVGHHVDHDVMDAGEKLGLLKTNT